MHEQEVLALLRAGDERGAEALLRHYAPLMRYIIAPIVPDAQDREECLSDAALRVWEKFGTYDPARGSWTAWLNLLALGVITNYGAYLAYGRSLRLISQVKAAIIGNIEPVLATFWVWLFWHENFSFSGWAGSALVLSAVFLLTADRN